MGGNSLFSLLTLQFRQTQAALITLQSSWKE